MKPQRQVLYCVKHPHIKMEPVPHCTSAVFCPICVLEIESPPYKSKSIAVAERDIYKRFEIQDQRSHFVAVFYKHNGAEADIFDEDTLKIRIFNLRREGLDPSMSQAALISLQQRKP